MPWAPSDSRSAALRKTSAPGYAATMNADCGLVLTTFANPETGRRLTDGLLEKRLAACVQTLPIQSAYRWKGAIQREPETLVLIKTQAALYPEVEAFIRSVHDYETPEIVFIPIAAGSAAYLRWLGDETAGPARSS